jgi:hypothetical protein
MMKKRFIMALVAGVLAAAALPAQGWGGVEYARPIAVEGTLRLHNGHIAVASGESLYYIPALARYTGFIDGLQEGVRISVEGYVGGYSGSVIHPSRIKINERSYEFPLNERWSGYEGYQWYGYNGYRYGYGYGGYGGCQGCWGCR